jgi:hypothetical protein
VNVEIMYLMERCKEVRIIPRGGGACHLETEPVNGAARRFVADSIDEAIEQANKYIRSLVHSAERLVAERVKYTAGPWNAEFEDGRDIDQWTIHATIGGETCCTLADTRNCMDVSEEEECVNARLMAAAPTMYEALLTVKCRRCNGTGKHMTPDPSEPPGSLCMITCKSCDGVGRPAAVAKAIEKAQGSNA